MTFVAWVTLISWTAVVTGMLMGRTESTWWTGIATLLMLGCLPVLAASVIW